MLETHGSFTSQQLGDRPSKNNRFLNDCDCCSSSYWDPGYDLELMSNQVALNMLYIQTVADVEKGWVLSSKEVKQQLASLQARGAKKEVCCQASISKL
jgi:sorting nexin-17